MKKILTIFSLVVVLNFAASAQIVINEVLYNIPGAAAEVEEFIELYNGGATAVNLQGYRFTQGVTYTFGSSDIIPAGGYFIVAADSAAFNTAFGIFPNATFSGGLSNSGEDIAIVDMAGSLVDSVNYDDAAPWPLNADGAGFSLQLCDATTDNNDGANWGTSNDYAGSASSAPTDSIFATPGMMNNCQAVIPPPPASYPLYTIDMINGIDTAGNADSVGVTCELRAVAYCNDNRAGGYDFPFANSDNSNGIRVFSFNDVSNYAFVAGDSLHIFGTVSQFNGLLQFAPDSIVVATQGVATPLPMMVTSIGENEENKYVVLNNVMLVDTAEWTGTGSGFNVSVTDGSTDTTVVRIDNDVDLYNQPAPMGTFSIAGWVTQFDATSPRTEGYSLVPCSSMNITAVQQIENNSTRVAIYPNPTYGVLNIESEVEIESIQIHSVLGQLVFNQMNVAAQNTQINTANLENGIYIISIQTEDRVMTQQIKVLK